MGHNIVQSFTLEGFSACGSDSLCPASRHKLVVLGIQLLGVYLSIGWMLTQGDIKPIRSWIRDRLNDIGVSILVMWVIMMVCITDVLVVIHLHKVSLREIVYRVIVELMLLLV